MILIIIIVLFDQISKNFYGKYVDHRIFSRQNLKKISTKNFASDVVRSKVFGGNFLQILASRPIKNFKF
jgi:hypothetical protein